MSDRIDNLVQKVETIIGRSTATAFVTPDVEDRYFIFESVLTGAALYLINQYFNGFFKPVEEAGARHRETAIRILKDLSKGFLSQPISDESRHVVQHALTQATDLSTVERRAVAEKEVYQVLREYGESEIGAAKKAAEITGAIFGN